MKCKNKKTMRCIGSRPTVRTGEVEKLGDKMVQFLTTIHKMFEN